jgi:broad specificity phosphatase PhoE
MNMKTKIILARHGETDWNHQGKMQGRTDIPLNHVGREQAHQLQKQLKDIDIDVAYSSTLKRAIETAELAIRNRNIPLHLSEELVERDLGIFEGACWNSYSKALPYDLPHEDFLSYKHHSSMESFSEVFIRVSKELLSIAYKWPDRTVLVACHGAVIKSFLLHLDPLFPKTESISNGALLHCIATNNGIQLERLINN